MVLGQAVGSELGVELVSVLMGFPPPFLPPAVVGSEAIRLRNRVHVWGTQRRGWGSGVWKAPGAWEKGYKQRWGVGAGNR